MGGSQMSKRRFLRITLPFVLLSAVAVAVWFARPGKAAVSVEVSGTPGLVVKGTCEVDGTTRELTGVVPTGFVVEGSRVTFLLASTEGEGEFRVKAAIDGIVFGSATSGNPPKNGIRGWVKSGWWWSAPNYWLESFAREGQ